MHIYVGAMESQPNNLRINKSGEVTFSAGLSCFEGLVHPKFWRLRSSGGSGDIFQFCLVPIQTYSCHVVRHRKKTTEEIHNVSPYCQCGLTQMSGRLCGPIRLEMMM